MNISIKKFLLFTLLIIKNFSLSAQSAYDLRLELGTIDCTTNTACFNVQVRSSDGNQWGLAGQNYRLFYDGSVASFSSGASLLGSAYQSFSLAQDVPNTDATGTGSLPFESTLRFLNYSIDLNNTSTGGATLLSDGSWLTTSQICFDVQPALFTDPTTCFEGVWSRSDLTNDYATSFVEISEWVAANNTQMAVGATYEDLINGAACFSGACAPIGSYDIRLNFNDLNCQTSTICYDVQLRSNDGNQWGLAGQNYRLFYDGSLATYQSGISLLGIDNYNDFELDQNILNQDATGTGTFAFEDNLNFLNYSIELSNTSSGGVILPADGSWLTTSQICFLATSALLDEPANCLEAVWARMDTSAAYATSFVEVAEWVQANSTQMAEGQLYDGLATSDEDAACFAGLCVYDFGDLPDTSANMRASDYQTLAANNGPSHLIILGLSLGTVIDDETEGQSSIDALGDGLDEDGLMIFSSLDIQPNSVFRLALNYVNTTGNPAYIEAWIDWNNNGDFDNVEEIVFDVADPSEGLYDRIEITVPLDAVTDELLGLRIRISHQENMTPYGEINSGEVEDYFIKLACKTQVCLPVNVVVKKQ